MRSKVGSRKVRLSRIYALAFRRLRELRGWSQTELGDRMGTTKATVSKIETGKQGLTVDVLEQLLDAVEVDLTMFHRLCQAIRFELETLALDGSRRSARTSSRRASARRPVLPLLRQSLGPLPGSELQLRLDVSLQRCPEPEEDTIDLKPLSAG